MRNSQTKASSPRAIPRRKHEIEASAPKADLLYLFEAACSRPRYDGNEDDWDEILKLLNLPLCYQSAISKVLSEGRWRSVSNPRAYIATAAWRQASKLRSEEKLTNIPRASLSKPGEARTDLKSLSTPESEDRLENFLYQIGSGDVQNSETWEEVPDWLSGHAWGDEVDWKTAAKFAVNTKSMERPVAKVLQLKFRGVSRDRAMEAARSDRERREIEAAWKWVDRNMASRIAPLFKMDKAPSQAPNKKDRFVPPGEAIKLACSRERLRSDFSSPSIMTPVRHYPQNTMPLKPSVGVFCREVSTNPKHWARRKMNKDYKPSSVIEFDY